MYILSNKLYNNQSQINNKEIYNIYFRGMNPTAYLAYFILLSFNILMSLKICNFIFYINYEAYKERN